MTTTEQTKSELTRAIGQRIRAARRQAGMTQRQLGRQIGVSGVSISDWERGVSQPTALLLWQLANVVGKPATYFLPVPSPALECKEDEAEEHFLKLFRELSPELRQQTLSFMGWAKQEQ